MVKLSERPFFTKTGYSEDPINNAMYGLDFSYRTEVPRLTKMGSINYLFYNATEMSTISAYGEGALLKTRSPQTNSVKVQQD